MKVVEKGYTWYGMQKAVEEPDEVSIREASSQLSIPRKHLQWCIKHFRNSALTRGVSVRSIKKMGCSKAKYPCLKSALVDYIKEEREKRNSNHCCFFCFFNHA